MVGIAVVLLGAILGTIVVQSTLTPLKRIEKTAAKIAAGDLSQRVPDMPENTEVGSLSVSLNTMLTRIEESFHAQAETTEKMKQFVSDASHELRTPLAAIHGYAELYKMQRDMPGALERADESIEHIEASSARMTVLVEDRSRRVSSPVPAGSLWFPFSGPCGACGPCSGRVACGSSVRRGSR